MTNVKSVQSVRLANVKAIGRGDRLSEVMAVDVVATLPDGFDPKVRGAVTGAIHAFCGVDPANPGVTTGGKGQQTPTLYGLGVNNLAKKVKALLSADAPKPVRLAVTMSGDGAPVSGTVVVAPDHALYAALVALLATDADADAAA